MGYYVDYKVECMLKSKTIWRDTNRKRLEKDYKGDPVTGNKLELPWTKNKRNTQT